MTDLEKERILHKIVAGSAFLFALCILPIAQYLLVTSKLPSTATQTAPQGGIVAGVSTDTKITDANISTSCLDKREKDLSDLQLLDEGKKKALLRDYEAAIKGYQEAKASLAGTPSQTQQESASLDRLIAAEYDPYITKLNQLEVAVDSQKKEIESRSCTPE